MSRYLNESDGYLAYDDQHVIAEAIRLYRVDKHLLEQIEKEDNEDRFYEMTKDDLGLKYCRLISLRKRLMAVIATATNLIEQIDKALEE